MWDSHNAEHSDDLHLESQNCSCATQLRSKICFFLATSQQSVGVRTPDRESGPAMCPRDSMLSSVAMFLALLSLLRYQRLGRHDEEHMLHCRPRAHLALKEVILETRTTAIGMGINNVFGLGLVVQAKYSARVVTYAIARAWPWLQTLKTFSAWLLGRAAHLCQFRSAPIPRDPGTRSRKGTPSQEYSKMLKKGTSNCAPGPIGQKQ